MPNDENDTTQDNEALALEKKIVEVANAAVSSQLKRFGSKIDETLKKSIAEAIGQIKTTAPADEDSTKQNQANQGKVAPEIAAMQAKLDEALKTVAAEREARVTAEKKQLADQAFNELRSGLASKVRPEMLDIAARDLFHSQNRIVFDDSGVPLFKTKRSPGAGYAEEEVLMPLKDGIQHFLGSKEATPFLPAPGGTQQQQNNQSRGVKKFAPTTNRDSNGLPVYDKPAKTEAEKIQRAMEVEQALTARRQ